MCSSKVIKCLSKVSNLNHDIRDKWLRLELHILIPLEYDLKLIFDFCVMIFVFSPKVTLNHKSKQILMRYVT